MFPGPVLQLTKKQQSTRRRGIIGEESSMMKLKLKLKLKQPYPISNHLMINTERYNACIPMLYRSKTLDALARLRAEEMAKEGEVFVAKTNPKSVTSSKRIMEDIKENCFKGPCIQTIHELIMNKNLSICKEAKDHILNPKFTKFGMAAVKDPNDPNALYICQLFW